MQPVTRRSVLLTALGATAFPHTKAPVVNGSEHAWVLNSKFPMPTALSVCPGSVPQSEYSAEYLLSEMSIYKVNHVVISHVCYYGRDNSYPAWCIKRYPGRFAAIGLLVGHRLYAPDDIENPNRLEHLMKNEGLAGLRISPIYDKETVWFNNRVCYPLWRKAEQLGATFNIFCAPHQVSQVADMAARFPGVNVVIDHMAMIDIAAPDSDGFGPLLEMSKLPNVYARTSLHNPSKTRQPPFHDVWPFLHRLYDAYGPKRLVWANFFEYLIMKELIPFFTTEDKEWILGRTGYRLYGFEKTAGKA
jgi:predicted TIM-barrel fold metal-dependent hydrolase